MREGKREGETAGDWAGDERTVLASLQKRV